MNIKQLSDEELDKLEHDVFNESIKRRMKISHDKRKRQLILYIAWRNHYFNEFNEWNFIGINPSTCDHPEEYYQSVGGITAICNKCGEYYDDIDDGQNIFGTK